MLCWIAGYDREIEISRSRAVVEGGTVIVGLIKTISVADCDEYCRGQFILKEKLWDHQSWSPVYNASKLFSYLVGLTHKRRNVGDLVLPRSDFPNDRLASVSSVL